jgi:hypothetical protein
LQLLRQEGQQVGVVADHFPLAVFVAEDIGRPQRDRLGIAVDEVLSDFVALDASEILAEGLVVSLSSAVLDVSSLPPSARSRFR